VSHPAPLILSLSPTRVHNTPKLKIQIPVTAAIPSVPQPDFNPRIRHLFSTPHANLVLFKFQLPCVCLLHKNCHFLCLGLGGLFNSTTSNWFCVSSLHKTLIHSLTQPGVYSTLGLYLEKQTIQCNGTWALGRDSHFPSVGGNASVECWGETGGWELSWGSAKRRADGDGVWCWFGEGGREGRLGGGWVGGWVGGVGLQCRLQCTPSFTALGLVAFTPTAAQTALYVRLCSFPGPASALLHRHVGGPPLSLSSLLTLQVLSRNTKNN
jgi:hypothetical protein